MSVHPARHASPLPLGDQGACDLSRLGIVRQRKSTFRVEVARIRVSSAEW